MSKVIAMARRKCLWDEKTFCADAFLLVICKMGVEACEYQIDIQVNGSGGEAI